MNLSIIIVSYNTKELLRRCLESVVSGQWLVISERNGKKKKTPVTSHQPPVTSHQPPITEIIVVDNGSTDGSVEMIEKTVASVQRLVTSEGKKKKPVTCHQPPVTSHQPLTSFRLIKNSSNLGFAKGVNQALRHVYTERSRSTQGKVVLLLNSDTRAKLGSLGKLLEFEKKVRPAIIGLKMLNPDGSVQGSVFNLPTMKRAIEEFWLGKKGSFSKFAPTTDMPIEVEAVSGGAMAISSEIVQKIGLFDEKYFMYFEDLDYCRRARRAGFKVYYFPPAEIIHEHGASGKSLTKVEDQWKRLIPSSKIYHGLTKHYLINFIILFWQKWRKFFGE